LNILVNFERAPTGWASLPSRFGLWRPDTQRALTGGEFEVVVGTEKRQVVPNAQLSKQRVDCADLNSRSATGVAEFGGCNMVFAIRLQQWKRCEALNDLCSGLRSGESLKQFLENQPGRNDDIGAHKGVLELLNCRFGGRGIAAQGERPNARVNQQSHDRERSAL